MLYGPVRELIYQFVTRIIYLLTSWHALNSSLLNIYFNVNDKIVKDIPNTAILQCCGVVLCRRSHAKIYKDQPTQSD